VPDSDGLEKDFREFVAARSGALLRTAYLLAGDWATAEDLLQISLTKTFLAWKRLGRIEAVEPYTRRVLVNTATSWWRRRWHGERPTDVLPESATADGLDERLERDALWRHVRELPTRQRAVLVLRFYEDLSEADTARLLGVSVGTVKSQCSRALATLRLRLAEQGIEPAAQPKRPVSRSVTSPAVHISPQAIKTPLRPAQPAVGVVEVSANLAKLATVELALISVDVDLSGHLAAAAGVEEATAVEEPGQQGNEVEAPIDGVMASAEQGQGS
jgi:RNA polymerase sigma-70 factor (sigma-E family)